MSLWCSALALKFQKSLSNMGYNGHLDNKATVCIRDTEKTSQTCHGSYGASLICRAKVVALLLAPDAQWTNCTGFSNIVHTVSANHLRNFMDCTSKLFTPPSAGQPNYDWESMKRNLQTGNEEDEYDYIPAIYDKILTNSEDQDD